MILKIFEQFINEKVSLDRLNDNKIIRDYLTVGDIKQTYKWLDNHKYLVRNEKDQLICINKVILSKNDGIDAIISSFDRYKDLLLKGYIMIVNGIEHEWNNFVIEPYKKSALFDDIDLWIEKMEDDYSLTKKKDFFNANKNIKPILNDIMKLNNRIDVIETDDEDYILEIKKKRWKLFIS